MAVFTDFFSEVLIKAKLFSSDFLWFSKGKGKTPFVVQLKIHWYLRTGRLMKCLLNLKFGRTVKLSLCLTN
jgi:hypothetical protein